MKGNGVNLTEGKKDTVVGNPLIVEGNFCQNRDRGPGIESRPPPNSFISLFLLLLVKTEKSVDGSCLNYDYDEENENGNSKNENSTTVTGGDQNGKRKGAPAKNLMAGSRRRKKLNDRIYMQRSVVIPKISKTNSLLDDSVENKKSGLVLVDVTERRMEIMKSFSSGWVEVLVQLKSSSMDQMSLCKGSVEMLLLQKWCC